MIDLDGHGFVSQGQQKGFFLAKSVKKEMIKSDSIAGQAQKSIVLI